MNRAACRPAVLLLAFAALALAGCGKKAAPSAAPGPGGAAAPFRLVFQLDWVPEPEHGGFYQAQARGFYREAGLEVEIVPGGPSANVKEQVVTGRAHVAMSDSTGTLAWQAEGLPIMQVGAVFQDVPSGLLVSADSSVRGFADLQGKTVIARPEWPFLKFIQQKYNVTFNVVPQTPGSVAAFLAGKEAIQMGYYIAEPYHIVKAGGKEPRFLSTWDAGFRAYAVLITGKKFAREHPAELRAFLAASVRGWHDYLDGDPAPAHAALKAAHKDNTDEFMAASRRLIIEGQLVTGRGADGGPAQVGRISRERFATQIGQLEALGVIERGKIKVDDVMTTDFLP
jgi:NitT/TauT family transport system substrate-binding protein